MSLSQKIRVVMVAAAVAGGGYDVADAALIKHGGEYRIVESLPGDQVRSHMSFGAEGGFLITQDNYVDGDGMGIRARQFTADLSGMASTLLVNTETAGDQQHAKVVMLPGGGAAFVWESVQRGSKRIRARFLKADGTFTGPDVAVSEGGGFLESHPAIAAFSDRAVVIVWQSYEKDGSLHGIYARRFSGAGAPIGSEFQVNQWTRYNQRDPAVAVLDNDDFVVIWVSEEQRTGSTVDIYGRRYNFSARPIGGEFRVSDIPLPAPGTVRQFILNGEVVREIDGKLTSSFPDVAAKPEMVAVKGKGFVAAWCQHPGDGRGSWDVYGRAFDLAGSALSGAVRLNSYTSHSQMTPRLAAAEDEVLAVWTSYAQDGADEGIYGQLLKFPLQPSGMEFRANTTTISKQLEPSVSAYAGGFVVGWSAFRGGIASFDLFAQRYQSSDGVQLAAPSAPFVSALSQDSLCVTWPEYPGEPVRSYLLYVDGEEAPIETQECYLRVSRPEWLPGSTHSFQLAYQMYDGRTSPKSSLSAGVTWGVDANGDGLPDDWQRENWGKVWPEGNLDSDGDGATNLQEFYAGTDPVDASSVLRTELNPRDSGLYLDWNTEPGSMYQVQITQDLKEWENYGPTRFAHSSKDTVLVTTPANGLYFRVIRMR